MIMFQNNPCGGLLLGNYAIWIGHVKDCLANLMQMRNGQCMSMHVTAILCNSEGRTNTTSVALLLIASYIESY